MWTIIPQFVIAYAAYVADAQNLLNQYKCIMKHWHAHIEMIDITENINRYPVLLALQLLIEVLSSKKTKKGVW